MNPKQVEATNAAVDRFIATMVENDAPLNHVRMIDLVFRNYSHTLWQLQYDGARPGEVIDALQYTLAVMITETLVRIVPRDKIDAAVELTNEMFAALSKDVVGGIESNFLPAPLSKPN